jgi:hypothetical protein
MTKTARVLCLFSLLVLFTGLSPAAPARLSLSATRGFEPNRGQSPDPRAEYISRLRGYLIALDGGGASFDWNDRGKSRQVRLQLVGSFAGASASGDAPMPGKVSYFSGSDPANWHTAIPTFARVRAHAVYPGIDVVYYRNGDADLEHDFVVAPNADPGAIRISISGADRIRLDRGEITLGSGASQIRLKRPVAYQQSADGRREVPVAYELHHGKLRFHLGAYDRTRELVIDPAAVFVTYIGGAGADSAKAVALDASGNTYVAGSTDGLPTTGTKNGSSGAFVIKFDTTGQMIYSVVLGPNGPGATGVAIAGASSITVDAAGRAIIGGNSMSTGFPVYNGYSDKCGVDVGGAFVTVLNAAGTALDFSTCISGSGWPNTFPTIPPGSNVLGIAIDGAGMIYAGGWTQHTNFLTTNPRLCDSQPCATAADGPFVAKFDPTKTGTQSLVYSTMFSNGGVRVNGLALQKGCASDCSAFVAGQVTTINTGLPITAGTIGVNVAPGENSGRFISKINSTGTAFDYSTLLTSTNIGSGIIQGITVDADGNAYVVGFGGYLAASDPVQQLAGACRSDNDLLTKVNSTASAYLYQACFDSYVSLNCVAVDDLGNAYVTGQVGDSSLNSSASSDALQPARLTPSGVNLEIYDAFLSKVNSSGTQLLYTTYVGGPTYDSGTSIALNGSRVAVAGNTQSRSGFPLVNPYQAQPGNPVFNSGSQDDAFVATFDFSANAAAVILLSPNSPIVFADQQIGLPSPYKHVTVTASGNTPLKISSVTVGGDFGTTNDCPASLPVASFCTITLWFTPSVAGARSATLTITSNATGSPHTIALSGNGYGVAGFTTAGNLTFPQTVLGAGAGPNTFTLTSNGTASLIVSSITSLTPEFGVTTDCSAPVPANSACNIFVTFSPTDIGNRFGTIKIFSNAPGSPATYQPFGIGAAPVPTLTAVIPNTGTVGRQSMTVTLTGTNFIPQTTATVGGQGRIVTYVNSTTLKVALISNDLAALGTKPIVVTNPTPGGGTSNSVSFTIATNSPPEGAFEVAENEAQAGSASIPQLGRLKFSGWAADPDDGSPVSRVQVVATPVETSTASGIFFIGTGVVRRISPGGIITTIAGNGTQSHTGDGGLATSATVAPYAAVSMDAAGNIYIPEGNNPNFYIRKIDAATGIISIWAGNNTISTVDGQVATNTGLPPNGNVVFDSTGNAYVASGTRIKKIAAGTKIVSTYAGTGTQGNTGDGGLATSATLCSPYALAIDAGNNLYFSDPCNHNSARSTARPGSSPPLPVPVSRVTREMAGSRPWPNSMGPDPSR